MQFKHNGRVSERGNVLFLILIAVALFAALSYAVTQSTRSGGGDASKETGIINASQILQVPASYRTAVQRMVISQNIDGSQIVSSPPTDFSSMSANMLARDVYYPSGGGMPYPIPPKDLMDPTLGGVWALNSENEVKGIGTGSGTTTPTIDTVELMALLPGLKKSVCESINKKLGITGMPVSAVDAYMVASADPGSYMENGGVGVIGSGSTDTQLIGKPEGCLQSSSDPNLYIFYAVVQER